MMPNLFAHQVAGVEFLRQRKSAILADDPGLGKTAQALVASACEATIVVCPKIAMGVWADEAATWRPTAKVTRCTRKTFRLPGADEIVVINYDALPSEIETQGAFILIADEGHYLKNPKALRSRRFALLRALASKTWLLTGTPMSGNQADLFGVVTATGYDLSFAEYAFRAWGAYKGEYGLEWPPEPKHAALLQRHLDAVMLRRRKADVLDLPLKTRQFVRVSAEISARARQAHRDWKAAKELTPEELVSLGRLRLETAIAKIFAMLELCEEASSESPMLVFSAFRAPVDALAGLDGWRVITGDTPQDERERIVTDYQSGKLIGIGATIAAAGTALTLTRCSNVLFVDRDWTPANNLQAEDRCHRIGQTLPVLYRILVAEDTADERVEAIIGAKMALIDTVIERQSAPVGQPTQTREPWRAAYYKGRDGTWYASVKDGAVLVGDDVIITRKDGESQCGKVTAIMARKDEWSLCAFTKRAISKRVSEMI